MLRSMALKSSLGVDIDEIVAMEMNRLDVNGQSRLSDFYQFHILLQTEMRGLMVKT